MVDHFDYVDEAEFARIYHASSIGDTDELRASLCDNVHLIDKASREHSEEGMTAMHVAAKNGHAAAIELLVQLGSKAIAIADSKELQPIHRASMEGHVNAIETLVRLDDDALDSPFRPNGSTPLHFAAERGHSAVIEALVRLGSKAIDKPNANKWYPIHFAAYNNRVQAIETLVRSGSQAIDSLNGHGWTPLQTALERRHMDAIEALVRLGSKAVDTPLMGMTPLHRAAYSGHVSGIETLIRLGSKAIGTSNDYGQTPLHLAANTGQRGAIVALVRLGADMDALGSGSTTPFASAILNNRILAAKTLKALGARAEDIPAGYRSVEHELSILDEDFAADVRFQVYFAQSLVHRLLFTMPPHTQ